MKKYKLKLIIYNVNIIFFILLIFTIVQNNKAFQRYKELNIKEYVGEIYQVRANIDQQILTQVEGLSTRILNDEEIKGSIYNPDYLWSNVKIYRMKERMINLIDTYEHISGLDIYYNQQNMIFLSGSYKKLSDHTSAAKPYVDWIYDIENYDKAEYWIATRYYEPLDREVATFVATLPFIPSINRGKIAIHLNTEYIVAYANELIVKEESHLSIVNKDGVKIEGNINSNVIEQLLSKNKEDVNYFIYKDDIDRIIFFDESLMNDWIYVYDIPLKNVYNSQKFILENIGVAIVFILLSIGVSIAINLFIYGPINQIFSIIKRLPTDNEYQTMRSEAGYVKDKLSYTLERFEKLEKEMEQNKQIIFNNYIRNIMEGNMLVEDINEKGFDPIYMEYSQYFVMVIKLKMETENNRINHHLNRIRDQLILEDKYYKVFTLIENKTIKCIVNFNKEKMKKSTIIKKITIHLQNHESLSIGQEATSDKDDIAASYYQALEGLEYAYIMPDLVFLDYEMEGFQNFKLTGSREFIIGNIEKSILLKDKIAVQKELTHIIQAIRYGRYHHNYCLNTCREVCSTIRRAFKILGCELDELLGYDIRNCVKKSSDIYELEEILKAIIEEGLRTVENKVKTPDNQLKQDIIHIIDNNLCNNVSLQLIADLLEIRYDTLSKNFKSIIGCSFSQYIREEKLNKSIELLQDNKYTIKEISNMLGYNSTQYFIQLFKEKYDMTPKKYQQLKLLNTQDDED
ncbi:helix-turn-helix transcriptional regulator [Vallitalea okinawensis]|uniref:helix-turn-helix transcriptional regulator n=1 Tax=Vallitalea okinawensis TaxID=2078660 RepID=UPI000CFDAE3B|nr:AraC family transcriptional regulator [Vallitalea okinawensis]